MGLWKSLKFERNWHLYHSLLFKNIISSVQFSCSVVSDSLQPPESQHSRPPCPSPSPGAHSNSRPSSRWCHPAVSSSVVPFSSCPQSLPASESFPMSQPFAWGGQSAWLCTVAIFHIYEIVHIWHSVIIQYLFQWLICMSIFSFWNLCSCETVRIET